MKDRMKEFQQVRDAQDTPTLPGPIKSDDPNQFSYSSTTTAFFRKMEHVLVTMRCLESDLNAVQRIQIVQNQLASAATEALEGKGQGLSLGVLALSSSACLLSPVEPKEQLQVALCKIGQCCRTVMKQLEDLVKITKLERQESVSETEKRMFREQCHAVKTRLHTLLCDYANSQVLFQRFCLSLQMKQEKSNNVDCPAGPVALQSTSQCLETESVARSGAIETAQHELDDATLRLRDLQKIEEDTLAIKLLFEDVAFFVDSQDQQFNVTAENMVDASNRIQVVTVEVTAHSKQHKRTRCVKQVCCSINSVVLAAVLITALILINTGLPVTPGTMGTFTAVFFLAVGAILLTFIFADRLATWSGWLFPI
ncbi:hypothetical protein BV898_18097 [Hypsibius exemplaris]|uniref:t-SNARE coiled-coil homology domain-containing protein n=1 Tax=Hypsibius exemplaris TaxID=2072580 RepID=A0A9X6RNH7_HYPEX|nr:hypothetical protein BV898_18097 [Hypsibius exemplaris]